MPPCTPFTILCYPIRNFTNDIAIGDEATDIDIDPPVAAIGNCLVILNAASCWTAPTYAAEGTLSIPEDGLGLQIKSGELLLVPDGGLPPGYSNTPDTPIMNAAANIPITATLTPDVANDSQSNGAWFEWISEALIRVHRGSACGDCSDNCVAFTLQVVEFCSDVIQPIPT